MDELDSSRRAESSEAKCHRFIFLHDDAKQLPSNYIVAEKPGGGVLLNNNFKFFFAANVMEIRSFAALTKMRFTRGTEVQLILRDRASLRGRPVWAGELHAPESRCRGQEFDAYALALVRIVAEIDHPAFLLVLGEGIGEDEDGSDLQLLVEVEQGAVGVDNDRFAGMLKSPALMVLACEQHPDAHEHSGTAAFAFIDGQGHDTFMVSQGSRAVNLALR